MEPPKCRWLGRPGHLTPANSGLFCLSLSRMCSWSLRLVNKTSSGRAVEGCLWGRAGDRAAVRGLIPDSRIGLVSRAECEPSAPDRDSGLGVPGLRAAPRSGHQSIF